MQMATTGILETKKHGSAMFPFNIYPCTIPGDFPTVSLHWQQSMELIYIKKGRGLVQVGLEMVEAKKDDIFVLPPGTLHAMRWIPGATMEYENIIFEMTFLGAGTVDVCSQKYLLPLTSRQLQLPSLLRTEDKGYEELADCLREVDHLCEACGPGYELGVKAAMLRFLFLLLQRSSEIDQIEQPGTARLRRVLQLIEDAYSRPISVSEAAQACGCSESHFMRWFKQMSGSSFTSYLNERRLAAAAEALKQSDDTVLEIAERVGFENLSNFNRQFKARYGETPREYRRH